MEQCVVVEGSTSFDGDDGRGGFSEELLLVSRTKIPNHRDLYAPGKFLQEVFVPASKLVGVPQK